MRVLLWSYHNIWPLFFGVNMFTSYNSAENVLRNPSYRIFMDISFTTDMFTWAPPPRCYSTYKTWFLKIHPTFFSSNNFQILWERNPLHLPLPYFFLENRTQLLLPAFFPSKKYEPSGKTRCSLLVHYSPFFLV